MTERQSGRESFEDALDSAIDALRAGRPLERVLSDHPTHATSLRDVLDTALLATADGGGYVPPSARLAEHVTIVRAAAQRAHMAAAASQAVTVAPQRPSWWQRRLTFASLSIPAGVAVFALGASGAAAAAGVAAVTTDVPAQFVRAAAPAWVRDAVPGFGHNHDGDPVVNGSPTAEGSETDPAHGDTQTPGDINKPTTAHIAGVVTTVNGNRFTLLDDEGEWLVQIDASTVVDGAIAEGARASVDGDLTAGKNMHADAVVVTSPAPVATDDDAKKTPPGADKTPGPPENTPKPTNTPRPDVTPGPADRTPPPGPGGGQGPPEGSGIDGGSGNSGGGNGRSDE